MSEIPESFTLTIGTHNYLVWRLLRGEPDARIGPPLPVWAYRAEGERDRGVFHGVEVIEGETFAALKDRISQHVRAV